MKQGITLIEVALSILLGSLLASALFMSFSQLQVATGIADSFIEIDTRSTIMMHQMSRDITGACVPEHAFKEVAKDEAKATDTKEEKPQENAPEKSTKSFDLNTVFMVQHKNKNIDMISCITNNPSMVYDTVKPALARVVYRLVPDKEREGTFRLMRQESGNLDKAAFDKKGTDEIRAYEVAYNIKSCTCTCTYLEYAQDGEQKKVTKKDAADWAYTAQKASEQKMPILPYVLTLRTIFLDDQHRREWTSEFVIPIAAFQPYNEKKKEAKKEGTQEGQKKEVEQNKTPDQTKKTAKSNTSMSVMDLFKKDMDRYKKNNRILSQR